MTRSPTKPDRNAIARRICELAEETLCRPRGSITPDMDWNRDVFESLDEIDYILRLENEFDVSIPDHPQSAAEALVRDRRPFRMIDAADLVLLRWGTRPGGLAVCRNCTYPLVGLTTGVCSECGTRFFSAPS